ncbi:nucleotidyltransferase family protein [Sporolactobacillus pectinivorans]|uniref:nucleotidyltransferase family protein n=1 Tax=Sporolactobacillus pectinivorans TaxID=1591408 RepID=UPI000C25E4DA|nr:nucleotidyltransferase family protein [Sporolactobacillus pectinivorans]
MFLKTAEDIKAFIENDKQLMFMLSQVRRLDLPDSWICAGILRARIWDCQSGFRNRTPVHDADVIYFDPQHIDYDFEQKLQQDLLKRVPGVNWEVKNEARMHVHTPLAEPYTSTTDAISKFPETATAIGARLNSSDKVILMVPQGISDLIHMIVRPTPFFAKSEDRLTVYRKRIKDKNWQKKWPSLQIKGIKTCI